MNLENTIETEKISIDFTMKHSNIQIHLYGTGTSKSIYIQHIIQRTLILLEG
jgi:hypothetical protein